MGGGASIESTPYMETWKAEAATEPDDFSNLPTEEDLREELVRLRKLIRKQLQMVVSKDDNDAVLDKEIHALLDRSSDVEQWLTPMLQEIAAATENTELTGLQFRFKSFDSLKRKIQGDMKVKGRMRARTKAKGGGLDIAAHVAAVTDSLRYTILIPSGKYSETIIGLRKKLEDSGFVPNKLKNYWCPGDMYQGINDVFTETKSNLNVEIQYHTPESWKLKSEAHVIYEKFRICSEPLQQQELFTEGVALAATLGVPEGVMNLPTLTKKSAPELLDAYATQIVTACTSVKKLFVSWCEQSCPKAKSVEAVVDNEQIIGLELTSIMSINQTELAEAVSSYYDGFKVSVICSPDDYVSMIASFCSKFTAGPQYLTTNKGEKLQIQIKEARNTYDKEKYNSDDVEGVRLHVLIGSQETSSVYDNILCHVQFYTPESLETEKKVDFLSHMLVTNPSINCVNDEIHELWLQCPDPPGSSNIEALKSIPDIPC